MNKYVNWAITKEWEFSPVIKKITTKTILPKMIKAGPGALFKYCIMSVSPSGIISKLPSKKLKCLIFKKCKIKLTS